jgi:N-acetylmuramoyl-L-alanine amidase
MKLIGVVSAAISVSMLMAQTERPATRTVTAVRHWSLADVTRVAIEVSGNFQFVTEHLHDPERVYFDIADARPRIDSKRIFTEPVDDKLLKRIRLAQTHPGVTRIVLDLADSVETTTSQLTNPDRLIVELRKPAPGVTTALEQPPVVRSSPAPPMTLPVLGKLEAPKPDPPGQPKVPVKPPVAAEPEPAPAEPSTTQLAKTERPEMAPLPSATKVTGLARESLASPPLVPGGEVGKAARHTTTGETSLVRALGLKVARVVIDPGHGGHDQGTQGAKGLLEKELVLDVAKRVGKMIEDRMGAEVIYTRSDDTFVPLEGRTALANDQKADLFLSIHANSSPQSKIAGVEVYYLNFTDVKDSLDVASRENASSQKSIFELRDIIQKITLHDKAEESKEFAGRLQTSLYTFSTRNFPASKNRGVKKAPFVVLIGASMPSVLAEIGFLSNPREEMLLKKADYRQRLADALFKGVSRYADSLSHFQVAQAQK